MAELFTLPARATDSNGDNLSGAKLYFYATGTTTPQNVYTASDLLTPLSNPVVADSGGKFASIYMDPALTYRAVLKTSDGATTIYDIDPASMGLGGSGGADQVGTSTGRTVEERLSSFNGETKTITISAGAASASRLCDVVASTDAATTGVYSLRFATMVKTGRLVGGEFNISDTLITRYNDIGSGIGWGRWDVVMSPLAVGSGLTGAPTLSQSFGMVASEVNPQNRNAANAWEGESRAFSNWVGGEQMVPETQDFTSLLGTGKRRGYNIAFGYLLSKSPYTNDDQQRHAMLANGILANPNAIAPDGAFLFATGYKQFPTAVAISAAGSGYVVGDILTFNTGLSQAANQNTVLRVKTVDGLGAITGVEIYQSGWYQQSFASPISVTGGTGSAATFTYTMSTEATENPRAWGGITGTWDYGLDAGSWVGSASNLGSGRFLGGMIRSPNNTNVVVARNAADSADVVGLKINSSDRWELATKEIENWTAYVPTFTADSGSFTTVTVTTARYCKINGVVTVNVVFRVTTVGTAAGAIILTLPVNPAQLFTGAAANMSDGLALTAQGNLAAGNKIRLVKVDGTDPIVAGKTYAVSASYEV